MALIRFTSKTGQPPCPSDVLISLSFYMVWRQLSKLRYIDTETLKVLMDMIYSSKSLPSEPDMRNLNQSIFYIFDYLDFKKTREATDILEKFFADPSRSAEFFLSHLHTQMALWSLTSLTQDSSKHAANLPLELCEEKSTFRVHHSICVYHLSCASILSPA